MMGMVCIVHRPAARLRMWKVGVPHFFPSPSLCCWCSLELWNDFVACLSICHPLQLFSVCSALKHCASSIRFNLKPRTASFRIFNGDTHSSTTATIAAAEQAAKKSNSQDERKKSKFSKSDIPFTIDTSPSFCSFPPAAQRRLFRRTRKPACEIANSIEKHVAGTRIGTSGGGRGSCPWISYSSRCTIRYQRRSEWNESLNLVGSVKRIEHESRWTQMAEHRRDGPTV